MKKVISIICLTLIMIMTAAPMAFAGSFSIVESSPKDGATGMPSDNMGVKLEFNDAIYKEGRDYSKYFEMVDEKGQTVPLKILPNPEEPNKMLVLADSSQKYVVKQDYEYTLTISEKLPSAEGVTLGKEQTITFKTVNQKKTQGVSMALMFVMMGGIIFGTIKSQTGGDDDDKKKKNKGPVNPYKEAKKKGKSVEEIVEKDKVRKAKQEAKAAKERELMEKYFAEFEEEERQHRATLSTKHVSAPRPISAAGSTYVTGRKAEAEARAAAEAKQKAEEKARREYEKHNK